MDALEELVEDNATISERVSADFIEKFSGIEEELLERLLKYLKKFPTRGGRFTTELASTALLNQIRTVLEEIMEKEKLREAVRDLLPEFDTIADNVKAMHGEENDLRVSRALISDTKAAMIALTTQSVIEGGYDPKFALPVKMVLYNHVNFGREVLEAEKALRALIRPGDRSGVLSQYVGQVARDALNQYEGQIHQRIATAFELVNDRYVGNIVANSRCQCRRWVALGIIPAETLADEIRAAYRCGKGMIPGTTISTFRIYRGGYNCLHSAVPSRREPLIISIVPGSCKIYCPKR